MASPATRASRPSPGSASLARPACRRTSVAKLNAEFNKALQAARRAEEARATRAPTCRRHARAVRRADQRRHRALGQGRQGIGRQGRLTRPPSRIHRRRIATLHHGDSMSQAAALPDIIRDFERVACRHRQAGLRIPARHPRRRGRPPRRAARPHRAAAPAHEAGRPGLHRRSAPRRQPDDPRRDRAWPSPATCW